MDENTCDRYQADPDDTREAPRPCVRCGRYDHTNAAWRASFLHIMTDGMGMEDAVAQKHMANVGARLRGEHRPYPEVAPQGRWLHRDSMPEVCPDVPMWVCNCGNGPLADDEPYCSECAASDDE